MKHVSLYEAKTQLSALVDEASNGEEIVISKNGKAKARLVPIKRATSGKAPRKLGLWANAMCDEGKTQTRDEWLAEWKKQDQEIQKAFKESSAKPLVPPRSPKRRKG